MGNTLYSTISALRNFEVKTLPKGATVLEERTEEAEFYQIQGILDELVSKVPEYFEESWILTNEEHRSVLNGWLSPQEGKWKLLFRGSRVGSQAETFHSNKEPTVTIVKGGNYILEDSLKFRGTVNMLVVTGLNDSILVAFGGIKCTILI